MTVKEPVSGWHSFFSDLISNNDDKDIASLFRFVKSKLYQFRLSKHYTPREILTEAYIRGLEIYKKGDAIQNKLAWTRRTSYNVIREFRRAVDKHQHDDLDDISMSQAIAYLTCQHEDASDNGPDEDTLYAMRLAFSDLSLEDRELLNLKVVQELSWKQVHDQLTSCWPKVPTEGALRQRKRRALHQLAKCYTHYINHQSS